MTSPFQIGKTYANGKGSYELVHIDEPEGTMLIRYQDSGEEQEVSIKIQTTIWSRMQHEEQEEVKKLAQEEANHQKGYGRGFAGLKEEDFKTSTEGTTWRSRTNLAGKVARLASSEPPYTFVSWSIYGWPVAFLTHYADYQMAAFKDGVKKAKFTIEIDESFLYYGFYIEKADNKMDVKWDWPRLIQSLDNDPSLREAIANVEAEHDARFLCRTYKGDGRFHFSNGLEEGAVSLWAEDNPTEISLDERIGKLSNIQENHWAEIYLLSQVPKQQAINAGIEIAHQISKQFKDLFPIYTATTS